MYIYIFAAESIFCLMMPTKTCINGTDHKNANLHQFVQYHIRYDDRDCEYISNSNKLTINDI